MTNTGINTDETFAMPFCTPSESTPRAIIHIAINGPVTIPTNSKLTPFLMSPIFRNSPMKKSIGLSPQAPLIEK